MIKYNDEDWMDRMVRRLYKWGKGVVQFQVWRLNEGAINANEGYWEDIEDPVFSCHIHLYRVKPRD